VLRSSLVPGTSSALTAGSHGEKLIAKAVVGITSARHMIVMTRFISPP